MPGNRSYVSQPTGFISSSCLSAEISLEKRFNELNLPSKIHVILCFYSSMAMSKNFVKADWSSQAAILSNVSKVYYLIMFNRTPY